GTAERAAALARLVALIDDSHDVLWSLDFPFGLPYEVVGYGAGWPAQFDLIREWDHDGYGMGAECLRRGEGARRAPPHPPRPAPPPPSARPRGPPPVRPAPSPDHPPALSRHARRAGAAAPRRRDGDPAVPLRPAAGASGADRGVPGLDAQAPRPAAPELQADH